MGTLNSVSSKAFGPDVKNSSLQKHSSLPRPPTVRLSSRHFTSSTTSVAFSTSVMEAQSAGGNSRLAARFWSWR